MRKELTGIRPPKWKQIVVGAGVGILTVVALAGAVAGLVSRELVGISWIDGSAPVILVLSAFLAGKTAGLPMEAVLAVLGEWVVLFALNGLLFDGQMEGIGVTLLALYGGCGASLLLGRGVNKPHHRSHRRRKNR